MSGIPSFIIDLNGREAEVSINLNVLAEFEEATGLDLAATAPSSLTLEHLRKLLHLCAARSVPGITEQDIGAALMPYHVAEVLHILVALLNGDSALPGVWWNHREAVYRELSKRAAKLVDISPGTAWMANRYAADGRRAVVLQPAKGVVLHESVICAGTLREAMAHVSESGAFFASVPRLGLDCRELEDALLRGAAAYSVDVPCLAGGRVESTPIEGAPHYLIRQVR